jgi:hypothetical protein
MSQTMLFNPYSGRPRDPRDIQSDPEGILMLDPDEPIHAAPAAQPSADLEHLRALLADCVQYVTDAGLRAAIHKAMGDGDDA